MFLNFLVLDIFDVTAISVLSILTTTVYMSVCQTTTYHCSSAKLTKFDYFVICECYHKLLTILKVL